MQDEIQLTVRNDLADLPRVVRVADEFLGRVAVRPETAYAVQLALEEVLTNVIRHAYDDTDRHEIAVVLRDDAGTIEIHVRDDGRPFDPTVAPEVDIDAPLEERSVGGLGIHLVRATTERIEYRRDGDMNDLRIRV